MDILKDLVGMPGISFHYLLRGVIERGADLYSPGREAYEMLKGAVVGGPSLVFTRYHEAGVTGIRVHQFEEPRLCKKILAFNASALYLSTMLREMPCGKEKVKYYDDDRQAEAAEVLIHQLRAGEWFGFAEVSIEIPERSRPMLEEMCPFFYNKQVPAEAVPEHMTEYLARTGRQRGDGRKLVGRCPQNGCWCTPSAVVVREPRGGCHESFQKYRLRAGQDLSLVRGAGDRGMPDRRRGQQQGKRT